MTQGAISGGGRKEILIPDGDDVNDLDGVVNGQVRIQIDSNPQFVERVPLP